MKFLQNGCGIKTSGIKFLGSGIQVDSMKICRKFEAGIKEVP